MGLSRVKCDLIKNVCVISGGKWWNMQSDMVSLVVSTGLGVSVLAGILSGVCYVVAHGIHRKSKRKPNREWYCDVCGAYLRSIDGILEGDKVITCTKCQGRVCKHRCSSLSQQKGWTCKICLRPPESWFQGILSAIQPSSKVEDLSKMNSDTLNELDEDLEAIRKKEKEQVRDFIERLVSAMLGEDVDDANVTKLYNDKHYESIFTRYHRDLSNALTDLGSALHISIANLPVSGQSPCTAHAALKQLIERLLQETANLPKLQKVHDHPAVPSNENDRTYEDLLATAIINKVISSCQNNLPSSSGASVSSRVSNSSRRRDNQEYFFGEETLDSKWKTTDLDTSSVSSLDEWIHSDSSLGSRKYVDRVTLTIKQDIEEVSQTDSENEEDDFEYFQSSSLRNEDEQNWFLQKRQFQGTHSPVPVPMLVPNPTTEAKVLIGDREVDDTSDLSDVASDYGEMETIPGRQSLLVESKTIIGGKNPLQNGSESESSADSGVKEVDRGDRSYDITVDDDNVEDVSILSVYSNTEKEAEYTEKYGSLPRTIVKIPIPPSRPSLQKVKTTESTNVADTVIKENGKSEVIDDEEEKRKIQEFTGSYSKKEKEKWKHAIEMKNNPYSKENIEKRIQRSHVGVNSLFGPDYYARQASLPSGGKLKSTEVNETSPTSPKEENIHKAVPAIVSQEDDVFLVTEADTITPDIKPQIASIIEAVEPVVSEVTSDSDVSYINFYDVENSQIYKKTRNGEEVTLLEARAIPEDTPHQKLDQNSNLPNEKDNHQSVVVKEEDIQAVIKEVPQVKERKIISRSTVQDRPDYVKAPTFVRQRTLPQPTTSKALKRFKSETDLIDDSFDRPPIVISRKKDNTLISKIYLDPNVRSFALSSRHHLPVEENTKAKPPLQKQLSADTNTFLRSLSLVNGKKNYSSDDGISLTDERKKSYYSSEEDLIETSNKKNGNTVSKMYQNASVRNYRLKSERLSISSEEGLLSDQGSVHSSYKPYKVKGSPSITYSSSEDLLSIDGTERTSKKKDNTLISKIYQDPNVRNFALTNREYIPVPEKELSRLSRKSYSSEEDLLFTNSDAPKEDENSPSRVKTEIDGTSFTGDVSLDGSKIEDFLSMSIPKDPKESSPVPERKITSPDPDIDELAKKKIVHNILDRFSKSQPNLEVIHRRKTSETRKDTDNEEVSVSVKDLKKKFENNDAKNRVISSLTARSLSKQLRETLRN